MKYRKGLNYRPVPSPRYLRNNRPADFCENCGPLLFVSAANLLIWGYALAQLF